MNTEIGPLLPDGESLLIRTDFSNNERWLAALDAVAQPDVENDDCVAELTVIEDVTFEGLTMGELVTVVGSSPRSYVFIADSGTIADPECSILAVDTSDGSAPYSTFRVHPTQMPTVENNLSIANMDFEEFSSAVDADGVFRGFKA